MTRPGSDNPTTVSGPDQADQLKHVIGLGMTMPLVARRRGRPSVKDPLTPVTIWLPSSYAAKLYAYSLQHDIPVSQAARQMLIRRLRHLSDDEVR